MRFRTKMMLVFTSFFVLMAAVFLITLLGYIQGQFIDDVKFRRVSFVRYIRESLLDLVLIEDTLKLEDEIKLIVADMKQVNYIFVVGQDGKFLAHSFSGGFPAGLFEANLLAEGQEDKSLLMESNGRLVRDFAFRAVNHMASEIHVGMDETFVYKTISDTVKADLVQKGEYCESDIVSAKDKRSYHLSCTPVVHRDGSVSMLTIFRDTSDLVEMENRGQIGYRGRVPALLALRKKPRQTSINICL